MRSKSIRWIFGIGILMGIFLPSCFYSESAPIPSVQNTIHRIEERLGGWIALKADLTLHFLTSQDDQASCRGELTYHRLDEKVLLKCFNQEEELLFTFKTEDRNFEVFVPGQETVYQGSIFDLEDSPNVESHLKPLDLYRSLKLAVIPPKQTEITDFLGKTLLLDIYGQKRSESYLARRLFVSREGDVLEETYYDFDQRPSLVIRRSEVKQTEMSEPSIPRKIFFPYRIELQTFMNSAPHDSQKTILLFENVSFPSFIEEKEWT